MATQAAKVGDFDAAVEILRARVTPIAEAPARVEAAESEIATAEASEPERKEEE